MMIKGSFIGIACVNVSDDEKYDIGKAFVDKIYNENFDYEYKNFLYFDASNCESLTDKIIEELSGREYEGSVAIIVNNLNLDSNNKADFENKCNELDRLKKKFQFTISLVFDIEDVSEFDEMDLPFDYTITITPND